MKTASYYERLIQLAEASFDPANNPDVLDVDETALRKLMALHPAAVAESATPDGPVAWVLLLPTTTALRDAFLAGEIGENELLDRTFPGSTFETVYLCSALVLDEFRHRGLAKNLAIGGIENIKSEHPIGSLFVWPFSEGGLAAAQSIARSLELPLLVRPH